MAPPGPERKRACARSRSLTCQVSAAAFQGHAHAYTLALLATECTTPLVNLRYYLDKGGWREHPAYTANGMALLLRRARAACGVWRGMRM